MANRINQDLCISCGTCEDVCNRHALKQSGGSDFVNADLRITVCRAKAIETPNSVRRGLPATAMLPQ